MLDKKRVRFFKGFLFLLMVLAIFILPQTTSIFVNGMLFVVYMLLLAILNYHAEENFGIFKKRRDNLIFELLLVFLLLLASWQVY
ncbi:hypothetical protein [Enterococcus sp. AZ072]|uniref:hypothetical protein n=1 Tax=unclassified Enterococcus TaxID=2608891 RepID=UPI003D2D965A